MSLVALIISCHSREGGNPARLQEKLDSRLRGNDMMNELNLRQS